jgi:Fic-DOC domain mobile mystery protein B
MPVQPLESGSESVADEAGPPSLGLKSIGPEPVGATPLDEEDLKGLIPDFVATRADLNQVEYENIAKALPWARRQARLRGTAAVLQYSFIFELHRQMFGGTQRRRVTNIGVDPSQIPIQLKLALDDAMYWHDNDLFGIDERAARIHYRLVMVHPFPNGNGGSTRLVADRYLASVDNAPFSWGTGRFDGDSEARKTYIRSLVVAQTDDDFTSLVAFARS